MALNSFFIEAVCNFGFSVLLCVDLQCFGSGSAVWQCHCFGVFGKTFYNLTKVKRALWLVKWKFTNVKKAIGLMSKTTSLHVHHAFLYIPLPSLHNYDVKWPNFMFTWELERQADKFYHIRLNLGAVSFHQFQPKFPSFWVTGRLGIIAMKKVKGCEVYFSGSFPWTSPLLDRKVWCFTVHRWNVGTVL